MLRYRGTLTRDTAIGSISKMVDTTSKAFSHQGNGAFSEHEKGTSLIFVNPSGKVPPVPPPPVPEAMTWDIFFQNLGNRIKKLGVSNYTRYISLSSIVSSIAIDLAGFRSY